MPAIILEAQELIAALQTLKRYLYPDTPTDETIEQELIFDINYLLHQFFVMKDLEGVIEEDYALEALRHIAKLRKRKDWITVRREQTLRRHAIRQIQLVDSIGTTLITFHEV